MMDFKAYKNPAPYPEKPTRPTLGCRDKYATPAQARDYADRLEIFEAEMKGFRTRQAQWNQVQNDLNQRFKDDALREAGLLDHPKADKCWEKAWEHGHSSGNSEVLFWLKEFAEVVL